MFKQVRPAQPVSISNWSHTNYLRMRVFDSHLLCLIKAIEHVPVSIG